MPVMGGIEATRLILQEYQRLNHEAHVIALTSFANEVVELECRQAGMTRVENKPIIIDRLARIISEYFDI